MQRTVKSIAMSSLRLAFAGCLSADATSDVEPQVAESAPPAARGGGA